MKILASTAFFVILILSFTCCNKNTTNVIRGEQKEQTNGQTIAIVEAVDLDNDNLADKIALLLDDKLNVNLFVNNSSINVFSVDTAEQLFGNDPQDQYVCDLHVCGNKIIVGRTYTFTNKYGSTASIDCFEYNPGQISKIWSVPSDNDVILTVIDEITKKNIIEIKTSLGMRKIILSDEERKDYENYTSYLREYNSLPEFVCTAMPEYRIIDKHNVVEIITRRIVTCGACPVTQVYFQKYQVSKNEIAEKESWFGSEKPLLAKDYGFD